MQLPKLFTIQYISVVYERIVAILIDKLYLKFILYSLECQVDHQLGNNADTVVMANGAQINHDDLFNFDLIAQRYCIPTDTRPPTLNISFSSSVLVTEIGIHGLPLPLPLVDKYVKSFSLSYAVGDNITSYTSTNGLTVCSNLILSLIIYFVCRHSAFLTASVIILACGLQSVPIS